MGSGRSHLVSMIPANPLYRRALVLLVLSVLALGVGVSAVRADLWETLGLKKRGKALVELSEEQIAAGLREALAQGVQEAVAKLGRSNGFLQDVQVKIPLPSSLQRAESVLRGLGQEKLADDFNTALNRAAERAVPEAASVLADSVRQMSVEDARAILSSTNTAATDYFRRTSQTNLQARLLPIVKKSTAEAGVTASYKAMLDRAGLSGSSLLGGLGRSLLGADSLDLDEYVTRKALDGLFLKMGEEERRIRENPAARATELLRKVFR